MPEGTRMKSKARADRVKAMWDDPTVGADGLTYRQRRLKAMHAGRDRYIATRKSDPNGGHRAEAAKASTPATSTDRTAQTSAPVNDEGKAAGARAEGGGSGDTKTKAPGSAARPRSGMLRRWG